MRGVKGGSCLLFTDNFEAFFPFTVIFLTFTVNRCGKISYNRIHAFNGMDSP